MTAAAIAELTAADHLMRAEGYLAEAERQMFDQQKTERAAAYAALATAHYAAAAAKQAAR